MAQKQPSERQSLGNRLKQVRIGTFGEQGVGELARELGIPARSWHNYERGMSIPGHILLHFIELACVDPAWLLHGEGDVFQSEKPDHASNQEASSDSDVKISSLNGKSTEARDEVPPESASNAGGHDKERSVGQWLQQLWSFLESGQLRIEWQIDKKTR